MKMSRNLLLMFFFFMSIHICRRIIYSFTSVDITQYWCIPAIFFLFLATRSYSVRCPRPLTLPTYTAKLILLFVAIILLCGSGILHRSMLTYIFADTWIHTVILLFLILGQYDQLWEDIEKPLVILFWIGFAIVIVGLFRPTVEFVRGGADIGEIQAGGRGLVGTLGYDTKALLSFWPICFMLAYFRPNIDKWKILGISTAMAYLILQILFLKRAPSVRVLTYFIMVVLISRPLAGYTKNGTTILLLLGGVIIVIAFANTEVLLQRFKEAENITRFREAGAMLQDIKGLDVFIGRGMGGSYIPPEGWKAGTLIINKYGEMGNISAHIGVLVLYLKGGLLLIFLHLLLVVPLFRRKGRAWYNNRANLAAISILPIWLLFRLIEGYASLSVPYEAMVFAFTSARLNVIDSGDNMSSGYMEDNYETVDMQWADEAINHEVL